MSSVLEFASKPAASSAHIVAKSCGLVSTLMELRTDCGRTGICAAADMPRKSTSATRTDPQSPWQNLRFVMCSLHYLRRSRVGCATAEVPLLMDGTDMKAHCIGLDELSQERWKGPD